MPKYYFKNFKANWVTLIGVFIILMLSSVLLSGFSLLLSNAIYAVAKPSLSHLQTPAAPVSIFGSICGINIFVSVFCLYIAIVLSIKLRRKQFQQLRILGATFNNIRSMLYFEMVLMSIITLAISLPLGLVLAKSFLHALKQAHAIENNFVIYEAFRYQWIYVVATFALIVTIMYFAVLPIKNISISNTKNNFKSKPVTIVFQILFGLVALGGAIVLSVLKPILQDGLGLGMTICAVFCYVCAFAAAGKYIVIGFLFILRKLTNWSMTTKLVFSSLSWNAAKVNLPVALLLSFFLFAAYSINIQGLYGQKLTQSYEQYFSTAKQIISPKTTVNYETATNDFKDSNVNYINNDLRVHYATSIANSKWKHASVEAISASNNNTPALIGVSDQKTLLQSLNKKTGDALNMVVVSNTDNDFKAHRNETIYLRFDKFSNLKIKYHVSFITKTNTVKTISPDCYISLSMLEQQLIQNHSKSKLNVSFILAKNKIAGFSDSKYEVISASYFSKQQNSVSQSITFVVVLILALFNVIVFINATFQYFHDNFSSWKRLRQLGMTVNHLFWIVVARAATISIIGTLFGIVPALFSAGMYSWANGMSVHLVSSPPLSFIILCLGTLGASFFICLIPWFAFMIEKKHHRIAK